MGWQVHTLKYGKRLQAAFRKRDGKALERWIDDCPNSRYSALVYKGGAAWREALEEDSVIWPASAPCSSGMTTNQLHGLMTNLAGQDMAALLEGLSRSKTTGQPASLHTRSRATACPSQATRTIMPA